MMGDAMMHSIMISYLRPRSWIVNLNLWRFMVPAPLTIRGHSKPSLKWIYYPIRCPFNL